MISPDALLRILEMKEPCYLSVVYYRCKQARGPSESCNSFLPNTEEAIEHDCIEAKDL